MKVRILSAIPVDGVLLPCDCVPDLDPAIAASLIESGAADGSPDAVAYAEALAVPVPQPAATEPTPEAPPTEAEIAKAAEEPVGDVQQAPAGASRRGSK